MSALQLGQLLLGLQPRLPCLLQLGVGLPLGLGVGFGLLPRFVLQPPLLGRQRVGLAPLGQRLLELLGRQAGAPTCRRRSASNAR